MVAPLSLLSGAFLLVAVGPLAAQQVTVRAYLDQNTVAVNRQFVLNVEVSGTQQVTSEPELPDLEDFALYLGSGTSTSMQMSGGRTMVSVTFQYRFRAVREGSFEIGPVSLEAGGAELLTEPLMVTVTTGPPPSQQGQPGAAGEGEEIDAGDLFVAAEVSQRRVYQNEPVVVEYRIYTRVNVGSYSITRLPSTTGFWAEEYEQQASPEVTQVVRDGVQYASAVVRRVALFPTGPGQKLIEPIEIEAQVRVQRRSRDPFDSFFRLPSLRESRIPVVVVSEPVEIEVIPLPDTGRPAGFSGLVGEFDLVASLDKSQVEANEALTYRVTVEGAGNLRSIPDIEVDFPDDFEVYPPEVSEQINHTARGLRGSKTYEYVLVPRAPGARRIPSVELDYFDAASGSYARAASQPFDIEVTGDPVAGPVAVGRVRGGIDLLREDIRFIKIASPKLRPVDRSPLGPLTLWPLLLLPLLVVGGAWSYRRQRDRLEGDVAYARHRRANRLVRKRMAHARSLLSPNTQREFYAEVGRALQGYLGDKLNVAEAGLIKDDVRKSLMACGVEESVVDEYLTCLDVCDRQRFAPMHASVDDMTEFLGRSELAMTRLSRGLGR